MKLPAFIKGGDATCTVSDAGDSYGTTETANLAQNPDSIQGSQQIQLSNAAPTFDPTARRRKPRQKRISAIGLHILWFTFTGNTRKYNERTGTSVQWL